MKLPWILLGISAVLAAALALTFVQPQAMVSPGDLSVTHAALGKDCFACHAPFRGAAPERCVSCHAVADIGLRTTLGAPLKSRRPPFHQALTDRNCLACHSEHQGAHPALDLAPRFDHARLQPALRARCESCHAPPADALHRQIKTNCASCHQPLAWRPAAFDHARFFRLEGEHNVPCATCHLVGDFKQVTCASCHDPARTRAEHAEEGVRGDITRCASCHRGGGEEGEGREGRERDRD